MRNLHKRNITPTMKYILLFSLSLLSLCACSRAAASTDAPEAATDTVETNLHAEKRAVYYWKTVLNLDSAERAFLRRHDIGRMYVRLFDVVKGESPRLDEKAVPNASLRVDYPTYDMLVDSFPKMETVPVVYITLDALKAMKGNEGTLARNIVSRARNMCTFNGLHTVSELQLDCDWTPSTEQSFFTLCDSARAALKQLSLQWKLSSTIRLHQLARKVPPVDRGVLMVYNTGSFNDPDVTNSIIDPRDVEPYMKYLPDYKLHLDVAYPTYSWQLLFHDRKFQGLVSGLEVTDSSRFAPRGKNLYVALRDMPYNDYSMIRRGDMVRQESSDYADISRVRDMIERRITTRPHSTILYHLDINNLSKYSHDEIDHLLASGR